MRVRFLGTALLVVAVSCGVDLGVPDTAHVSCTRDEDCPVGRLCNPDLGRCVRADIAATAPAVTIGTIAQTTGPVEIPVTVSDKEGDQVTLKAEVGLSGAFATIDVTGNQVMGSSEGTGATLTWDTTSFFLGKTSVVEGLVIRLTPEDNLAVGLPVTSDPFDFGNDAPAVTNLQVETVAGVASGPVIVRLTISDTTPDPVTLTRFEVVTSAGTTTVTIDDASFPGLASLALTASGLEQTLVWNTGVAAAMVAAGARIELRVADTFDVESEVAESPVFDLDNSPRLTLGPLVPQGGSRDINAVSIPYSVSDPNGDAPTSDTVSLTVVFALAASGPWLPACADPGGVCMQGMSGSGADGTFVWNTLASAGGGVGLTTAPDGLSVSYASQVWVQATPVDSTGLAGPTTVLGPVALGNDPPITSVSAFTQGYVGPVPVELFLQDTAADLADVELQFQLPGESVWRAAKIGAGSAVGLASDPPVAGDPSDLGRQHVLVWDSRAPLDDDATVPQGIGVAWRNGVTVRARAYDYPDGVMSCAGATSCPDGTTSGPGPWSTAEVIPEVRNQTPPEVRDVTIIRAPGLTGTAPFGVRFRLMDAEGDLADVRAEISLDLGESWTEVREYPVPESEGFFDLATEPLAADGSGGVEHLLMLDPAGIAWREINDAYLRLSVTDGYPTGSPRITQALAPPLGATGPSVPDPFRAPDPFAAGYGPRTMTRGDFDGNGIIDLAVVNNGWWDGSASEYVDEAVTILLGQGSNGVADGTFVTASYLLTGAVGPTAIAAGDFNGDEVIDLVVANSGSDNVSILLGQGTAPGNGTFAEGAGPFAAGETPRGVAAEDFNGDGITDLAVTNWGRWANPQWVDEGISILVGLGTGVGDGTFAAPSTPFEAGEAPRDILALDFDGDEVLDLAVSNERSASVSILSGVGNGTFSAPGAVYPVGSGPRIIRPGDFNGDGLTDLAVSNFTSDNISVLVGQTLGGFSSDCGPFTTSDGPEASAVGDFNDDGVADLAVGNYYTGDVSILLGQRTRVGDCPFPATAPFSVAAVEYPWGLASGDFNHDGLVDLAVASFSTNTLVTLLGQSTNAGHGTFEVTRAPAFTGGEGPRALALGDFNDDGITDLAFGHVNSDDIGVLSGQGTTIGNGTFAPSAGTYAVGDSPHSLVTGDFDGDGITDLAAGNLTSDDVSILLGAGNVAGDGSFAQVAGPFAAGDGPRSMVTGDFDGNGTLDLAVANYVSDMVSILSGDGGGGFSAATGPFAVGNQPEGLTSGDFNGDGITDLATANYLSDDVVILSGDGSGNFAASSGPYAAGVEPEALATGDFNGDGVLDLAVADWAVDGVSILLGQGTVGDGTFDAPAGPFAVGDAPASVTTGDFDDDGIVDLALTNANSDNVSVLLGQGTGTFASASGPIDVGCQPGEIASTDLNSDGITDLVLGCYDSDVALVLFGRDEALSARSAPVPDPLQPATGRWGGAALPVAVTTSGRVSQEDRLLERLRDALSLSATPLMPLTPAMVFHGDVKLRRVREEEVPSGASFGDRLRVVNRLGLPVPSGSTTNFDRQGLDLSDSVTARRLVVSLPILEARNNNDITTAVAVRVFLEREDWVRASQSSSDPLSDYLPRVPVPGTSPVEYRDMVVRTSEWIEILEDTNADLSDDTEPRFVVVTDGATQSRHVDILTDQLGTFQAFLEVVP